MVLLVESEAVEMMLPRLARTTFVGPTEARMEVACGEPVLTLVASVCLKEGK